MVIVALSVLALIKNSGIYNHTMIPQVRGIAEQEAGFNALEPRS